MSQDKLLTNTCENKMQDSLPTLNLAETCAGLSIVNVPDTLV